MNIYKRLIICVLDRAFNFINIIKNHNVAFFAFLILLITTVSCNSNDGAGSSIDTLATDSVVTDTSISTYSLPKKESTIFRVYNADDEPVDLEMNDSTIYCSAATWCHFSKGFIESLRDPRFASLRQKYPMVILFDRQEAKTMLDQVRENASAMGITTVEDSVQTVSMLEQRAKEGRVIFPTVLSMIPKRNVSIYYFGKELDIHQFPVTYDVDSQSFSQNPYAWYVAHSPEDAEMINRLAKKYYH